MRVVMLHYSTVCRHPASWHMAQVMPRGGTLGFS
jgi:hypothetical protein